MGVKGQIRYFDKGGGKEQLDLHYCGDNKDICKFCDGEEVSVFKFSILEDKFSCGCPQRW